MRDRVPKMPSTPPLWAACIEPGCGASDETAEFVWPFRLCLPCHDAKKKRGTLPDKKSIPRTCFVCADGKILPTGKGSNVRGTKHYDQRRKWQKTVAGQPITTAPADPVSSPSVTTPPPSPRLVLTLVSAPLPVDVDDKRRCHEYRHRRGRCVNTPSPSSIQRSSPPGSSSAYSRSVLRSHNVPNATTDELVL